MNIAIEQHKRALETNGFTRIKGFYTPAELALLKTAIVRIVAMVYAQHMGTPLPSMDFDSTAFQDAFMAMIRHNRRLGGVVYDAIKQVPEFPRITSSEKHLAIAKALRDTDLIGITRGGDGIRIDLPGEEKFMAPWHQDYATQLGSLDGLVFWIPLVPITSAIGPLEVCRGSHREGPLPIYYENAQAVGTAYGMQIKNKDAILEHYTHQHLECDAGDLLVVDFLLLHRSGYNRSPHPRWSMQLRYFNFNHPDAIARGWPSGTSKGTMLARVHPELVVETV